MQFQDKNVEEEFMKVSAEPGGTDLLKNNIFAKIKLDGFDSRNKRGFRNIDRNLESIAVSARDYVSLDEIVQELMEDCDKQTDNDEDNQKIFKLKLDEPEEEQREETEDPCATEAAI